MNFSMKWFVKPFHPSLE